MHSARTDAPPPGRPDFMRGLLQRLNVRLVLVLSGVALLALLVSGLALSQILPGDGRIAGFQPSARLTPAWTVTSDGT